MSSATYDPMTDKLHYTPDPLTHDVARGATLAAAGLAPTTEDQRVVAYEGPWSPEGWALLTKLCGVIGDARPKLASGLTWDQAADRWQDPLYWHARAKRAVVLSQGVGEPEGSARVANLAQQVASMARLASEARASLQRWQALVGAATSGSAEARARILTALADTPGAGASGLHTALLAGEVTPIDAVAQMAQSAATLERWAERCWLHLHHRLTYFRTLQHPGDVTLDPAPARLIEAAQVRTKDHVCLIGIPDTLAQEVEQRVTAWELTCGETVEDLKDCDPGDPFDVLCLLPEREPDDILTALRVVRDGGRLLAVCSKALETALTPGWITLRDMREYLDVTTTALDAERLLLRIVV